MRRQRQPLVIAVFFLATVSSVIARELSFDERVRAQESIERVHYAHEIGAVKPFDEAVTRELLEQKVRTYLQQSLVLERFWHTPVTREMLDREVQRMVKGTRMPDRLQELVAALGNDPFVLRECLARQLLADRLSRNFFAYDRRVHEAAFLEATQTRRDLVAKTLDPKAEHPAREIVELVSAQAALSEQRLEARERVVTLGSDELLRMRGELPEGVGAIGAIVDERDSYRFTLVLEDQPSRLRVATYRFAKRAWDEWWREVSQSTDEREARSVASDMAAPVDWSASGSCAFDAWETMFAGGYRRDHTAVWTGSFMLVWGGWVSQGTANHPYIQAGQRYDPATDTWSSMSSTGSPSGREDHTAIWTGNRMIVWGGYDGNSLSYLSSGALYDPLTDQWTPMSQTFVPSARANHSAVWTGERMIVWGGANASAMTATGGHYDPATDHWSATSLPPIAARAGHTAAWTGTRMIVWGGNGPGGSVLATGALYDPATDAWTATATAGAPSARSRHVAVWTGDRYVIWGGQASNFGMSSGARYDPVANTWTPTSALGAPSERYDTAALWTGTRFFVWGGFSNGLTVSTGALYDPVADTWSPTSTTNAPYASMGHTAVWTGSTAIVWGGNGSAGERGTGGRYNPTTDTWTPTAANPVVPRSGHTAVWTGSVMVVFGGWLIPYTSSPTSTGQRYDPATDHWSATGQSSSGPFPMAEHSAVWTGAEMIVAGGYYSYPNSLNAYAARYDPVSDTWSQITGVQRAGHSAVWTGSRMILWGGHNVGYDPTQFYNSGTSYNPASNTWTPISSTGAPAGRSDHTAVWTGTRMIVWSGRMYPGGVTTNTGGSYDPVANQWTALSVNPAPAGRWDHTAVWTGNRMIVWGGRYAPQNSGGIYDPASDTWSWLPWEGAPETRYRHTAVWTGEEMVVWGGETDTSSVGTGGRYNPVTNRWATISSNGSPSRRAGHTAVWTGTRMIVWGGLVWGGAAFPVSPEEGGSYAAGGGLPNLDGDCDGYTENDGDCDDADPSTFPSSLQACDGVNNDCNDPGWPGVPVAERDYDLDAHPDCGDCAPTDSAIYPGAQQLCDGINNDCDDPSWPAVPANEGNADGDGLLDCVDRCPFVASPNNADNDGDGRGNDCDCAPLDSQYWSTPGEADDLMVSGTAPTSLSWSPPLDPGGSSLRYDLLRSEAPGDFSGAACVATDSILESASDSAIPSAQAAYFYLVRSESSCGSTLGTDSAGTARAGAACP